MPVYFTTSTPKSVNDVKGGYFKRSCTEEYYNDSGTEKLTNVFDSTNKPYNFSLFPYQGDVTVVGSLSAPNNDNNHKKRVATIWRNNATDDDADFVGAPFRTVISGVYSLRFTCYTWKSSKLEILVPMDRTVSGSTYGQAPPGLTINTYDLATGTPVPVAIRIDMKLMDPKDLKKLAIAIHRTNTKEIKILKQRMRTFSKVIYLGNLDN